MNVAPYVWFKCPETGKNIVDQVHLASDPLPSFFWLDCSEGFTSEFRGCGNKHRNTDVEVIAIGRYLALDKKSEFYDPERVRDFELFLNRYDYAKLPELPSAKSPRNSSLLSKVKKKLWRRK